MADPAFPTRQYPYHRPDPAAGPEPVPAQPLIPGTLYRFVVGVDPAPRPLTAEEMEALMTRSPPVYYAGRASR